MSTEERKHQTRVAIIGVVGVVLASLIGGIFLIATNFIRPTPGPVEADQAPIGSPPAEAQVVETPDAEALAVEASLSSQTSPEQAVEATAARVETPPAERPAESTDAMPIAIGDAVSDGVPAPGAGNLEKRDDIDVYTFDARPGQWVYFERPKSSANNPYWQWTLEDERGEVVFASLFNADAGARELVRGGRLKRGGAAMVGPYSFSLARP